MARKINPLMPALDGKKVWFNLSTANLKKIDVERKRQSVETGIFVPRSRVLNEILENYFKKS